MTTPVRDPRKPGPDPYCYISPQTAFRALLVIKERPGQGARSEGFEPPTF